MNIGFPEYDKIFGKIFSVKFCGKICQSSLSYVDILNNSSGKRKLVFC